MVRDCEQLESGDSRLILHHARPGQRLPRLRPSIPPGFCSACPFCGHLVSCGLFEACGLFESSFHKVVVAMSSFTQLKSHPAPHFAPTTWSHSRLGMTAKAGHAPITTCGRVTPCTAVIVPMSASDPKRTFAHFTSAPFLTTNAGWYDAFPEGGNETARSRQCRLRAGLQYSRIPMSQHWNISELWIAQPDRLTEKSCWSFVLQTPTS
jgi:hypothetical protein